MATSNEDEEFEFQYAAEQEAAANDISNKTKQVNDALHQSQYDVTQGGMYHFTGEQGNDIYGTNAPGGSPGQTHSAGAGYQVPDPAYSGDMGDPTPMLGIGESLGMPGLTDYTNGGKRSTTGQYKRYLAAASQGIDDMGRGTTSAYADAASHLGIIPQSTYENLQKADADKRDADQDLLNTPEGAWGYQTPALLASMAVPGTIGAQAAFGTGLGLLQPAGPGESRLMNAASTGAGSLVGAAGGRLASKVTQPISSRMGTDDLNDLRYMDDHDIPSTLGQRTRSPVALTLGRQGQDNTLISDPRFYEKTQPRAINKVALNQAGIDDNVVTPETLSTAFQTKGENRSQLYEDNPVNMGVSWDTKTGGPVRRPGTPRDSIETNPVVGNFGGNTASYTIPEPRQGPLQIGGSKGALTTLNGKPYEPPMVSDPTKIDPNVIPDLNADLPNEGAQFGATRSLYSDLRYIAKQSKPAIVGPDSANPILPIIAHLNRFTDASGNIDPVALNAARSATSQLSQIDSPGVNKWGGVLGDTLDRHFAEQATDPEAGLAMLKNNQELGWLHKIQVATKNGDVEDITPGALLRATRYSKPNDPLRQLAQSTDNIINSVKIPQSGTVPRLMAQVGMASGLGAAGEALKGDPVEAGKYALLAGALPLVSRGMLTGRIAPSLLSGLANSQLLSGLGNAATRTGAAYGRKYMKTSNLPASADYVEGKARDFAQDMLGPTNQGQ